MPLSLDCHELATAMLPSGGICAVDDVGEGKRLVFGMMITLDQVRSGFTYLSRNGFTEREDLDELIEKESQNLVQKAVDLMDHATWRRILKSSGLTDDLMRVRFMLRVPVAPLALVK